MDEAKFARSGLLAGVGAAVLIVASGFVAGKPPKLTDSDQKIVKFLADHQDALKIGSYLAGLSAVLFLWFLGSLYGKLRASEGGSGRLSRVGITGGVASIAVVLGAYAVYANAALRPLTGAYGFRLSWQIFGYASFTLAVFVSAVSVLIWSSGLLPKWFGYAGEAVAVGWLVAGASVSTENDTIYLIGVIVFLAWVIWLAALSVMLYRQDA